MEQAITSNVTYEGTSLSMSQLRCFTLLIAFQSKKLAFWHVVAYSRRDYSRRISAWTRLYGIAAEPNRRLVAASLRWLHFYDDAEVTITS